MYTLYYVPNACSLAVQVVLRELNQPVDIIDKSQVADFAALNPVGTVPVLSDGSKLLREGAATMLHLLNKHSNSLLPDSSEPAKQAAIQNIMFANATMHPAYSKLFFIERNLENGEVKTQLQIAAAENISKLWAVVESQLEQQPFLGGSTVSVADIMLAVYSRWGDFFPVEIVIGAKARKMIDAVIALPSFQQSLDAEQQQSAAA